MSKRRRKRRPRRKSVGEASVDVWLPLRIKQMRHEDALGEALSRASHYELRNRASGHGLAIVLDAEDVFWSRGWQACELGCGHKLDSVDVPMYVTEERRDGTYTWRRSCQRGKSGQDFHAVE